MRDQYTVLMGLESESVTMTLLKHLSAADQSRAYLNKELILVLYFLFPVSRLLLHNRENLLLKRKPPRQWIGMFLELSNYYFNYALLILK